MPFVDSTPEERAAMSRGAKVFDELRYSTNLIITTPQALLAIVAILLFILIAAVA